jgi:transglutaminase-like putative cysteine protease
VTLRVVHRTEYVYESPVSASYGQLYLLPREAEGQEVLTSQLHIEPAPDSYDEFFDFYGNRVANFTVSSSHNTLTVTNTSEVDVSGRIALSPAQFLQPTWSETADLLRDGSDAAVLDAREFTFASPLVPLSAIVEAYAMVSFWPGRGLMEAVSELTARIHTDIRYHPGATSVSTLPDEVLKLCQGVCQDFAHLEIACLRSMGLAARYVSGYLETVAPPGQVKLQGADASHAWLAVFAPGIGWIDVDPTNNCFVGNRHICTAWGRDYADVSPVKGVIFTNAKSNTMTVSVDVSHSTA